MSKRATIVLMRRGATELKYKRVSEVGSKRGFPEHFSIVRIQKSPLRILYFGTGGQGTQRDRLDSPRLRRRGGCVSWCVAGSDRQLDTAACGPVVLEADPIHLRAHPERRGQRIRRRREEQCRRDANHARESVPSEEDCSLKTLSQEQGEIFFLSSRIHTQECVFARRRWSRRCGCR